MTVVTESDRSSIHTGANPQSDARAQDGKRKKPGKRLAMFLDGTWNDPDANTNVWRLYAMTAEHGDDGIRQIRYYDPGVGTRWYDRVIGGMLGWGLSKNVRAAYLWLVQNYDPGDEVFIFGFSRGAYTARSLAGFIMRCGLTHPGAPFSVVEMFDYYRRQTVRPFHELEYIQKCLKDGKPLPPGEGPLNTEEQWLLRYADRIHIHFIGVFDTVGALGIPWGDFPVISRKRNRFHNDRLGVLFDNACHALAVDEHRETFKPTLWTDYAKKGEDFKAVNLKYEQRWFNGAHANVGGGYPRDPLALRPLRWMQDKAHACGLGFRTKAELAPAGEDEIAATDSFSQMMHGLYKFVKRGRRYYRTIQAAPRPVAVGTTNEGLSRNTNELVDESVYERCRKNRDMKDNLRDWWKRVNV